jgi:hypothetical protein
MVAERYHGSRLRAIGHALWWPLRENVRAFAHRFRPAEDKLPPEVEALLGDVQELGDKGDWDGALANVRAAADLVEHGRNPRLKRIVGNRLLPLGDCGRGLRLLAEPIRRSRAMEWQGENLVGHRLFIRQLHTSNMGAPIRMGRFVAGGLRRAAQCVVIVEHRLVPLFRRTFPEVEVRATGPGAMADARSGDFVTSFEGLGGHMVEDWPSVEATFTPLKADMDLAARLRKRYAATNATPLIGISWGSTNERKEVPQIAMWSNFIAAFPARFVVLQYGAIANALKLLRDGHDEKLIYDASVNQLADMDLFAAQIAATDAVVTVSNTGAHLASALGKRTLILIDNHVGRGYPAYGERSWWYPDTVMLRKRDRTWPAVLDEATVRLNVTLSARPMRA